MYNNNTENADAVNKISTADTQHDYVYILVRTDIPLEQQTVQAIHAGMIATQKYQRVKSNTHLVLLAIKDEKELKHWVVKLVKKDIPCEMFFEPDNEMGYSALATDCLTPQQGDIFQKLPLWEAKARTQRVSLGEEIAPNDKTKEAGMSISGFAL